jgi:hypothetical protein
LGSPTKENDSPVEVDKEKFDLNNEEFPELSLSVKVIFLIVHTFDSRITEVIL